MSPVVDGHVYITSSKIEMEGFLRRFYDKTIVRNRIMSVLRRLRKGATITVVKEEWNWEPSTLEEGYQWRFFVILSGDLAPNVDRRIPNSTLLGNTLRRMIDRYNTKFYFFDETRLHFQGANI